MWVLCCLFAQAIGSRFGNGLPSLDRRPLPQACFVAQHQQRCWFRAGNRWPYRPVSRLLPPRGAALGLKADRQANANHKQRAAGSSTLRQRLWQPPAITGSTREAHVRTQHGQDSGSTKQRLGMDNNTCKASHLPQRHKLASGHLADLVQRHGDGWLPHSQGHRRAKDAPPRSEHLHCSDGPQLLRQELLLMAE